MIYKILLILSLVSCTKYHELKKSGKGIEYVEGINSEIEHAKEVDWDAGRKREVNLSKGIRIYISIPSLSDTAKEKLMGRYGVNAWLFKISRIRKGMTQPMGYLYYRFENITRTTKNFTLSLFYHAASISKRFRLFHCPAFDHRLKIEDFSVNKRSGTGVENIYVRPQGRLPAKATRLRFAPMIVSGGRELKGKYTIDMALYNEQTKERFSSWYKIGNLLSIDNEVHKHIASCTGIKEELKPLPESRIPTIRDLEIK